MTFNIRPLQKTGARMVGSPHAYDNASNGGGAAQLATWRFMRSSSLFAPGSNSRTRKDDSSFGKDS